MLPNLVEDCTFYLFPDAEINFRNRKQAIYNLKNCNVLKINAEQKYSIALPCIEISLKFGYVVQND